MGFTGQDTDVDPGDSYEPFWRNANSRNDFYEEFSSKEFREAGLVKKRRVMANVEGVKPKKKHRWLDSLSFGKRHEEAIAGEHDVDLGHEVSLGIDRTVGEGIGSGFRIRAGGTLPYQERGKRPYDD